MDPVAEKVNLLTDALLNFVNPNEPCPITQDREVRCHHCRQCMAIDALNYSEHLKEIGS